MSVLTGLKNLLHTRILYVGVLMTCENHDIEGIKPLIDFQVTEVTEEDIKTLKNKLVGTGYPAGLDRAIQDGSIIYVAKNQGLLGFTLLNKEFITITDGVILKTLQPGEAYSHYSYVFPEHRGKKVFQRLKQVKYQREFNNGIQRIYSVTEISNKASMKAQEHLGVTKKQFVWLVDKRQLKHAKEEWEKSRRIPSRIIYEDDILFTPLSILGKLDMAYHNLKKTVRKKITGIK